MTEKEHELKMMLTKDEHHFLLRFFDKLMVESGLQTNYSMADPNHYDEGGHYHPMKQERRGR